MAERLTKNYREEEDEPKGKPIKLGKPFRNHLTKDIKLTDPKKMYAGGSATFDERTGMRKDAGITGSAGKLVNKLYNTY